MNNEATREEGKKGTTMGERQMNGFKADGMANSWLENISYDLRFGGEDVRLLTPRTK